MTMPKNKTLNTADRDKLFKFATDNLRCDNEKAALETGYNAAKPFVLAAVHAKYPPSDMKTMERYGSTRPDRCISFGGSYDNDSVFRFTENDADIPLVPRYGDCSSRSYDWTLEARTALQTYVLAYMALEKALSKKKEDYRRLIFGSRTFNDVVSVWPAAEKMRTKIIPETLQQRALAVLSEDAIARIAADNAGASDQL